MTGAVALAAAVGLLSLLAGVAVGFYLRRRCADCGEAMRCQRCDLEALFMHSGDSNKTPAG